MSLESRFWPKVRKLGPDDCKVRLENHLSGRVSAALKLKETR